MTTRESPYPQLGPNGQVVDQSPSAPSQAPYYPPASQQAQSHHAAPHHASHQQQYQPQQYSAPPPPPPQSNNYQMQSKPDYAPQQYQQQYQQNGGGNGGKPWAQQQYSQDYGQKVDKLDDVKPKWNDLIFAVLFVAQFLGFVAIAVISLRALGASDSTGGLGESGGTSITLNSSTAYLLAIISGAALVFSILLLLLVRAFTKIILEITLLLSVVLSVAYAIYLWIEKYWSGAIIFTLFAVISVISYFPMRRRIPLSRALLLFVLKIAKHNPSVYVIALAGTLLQTLYSIFWSFAMVSIYQKWHPDSAGSDTSGGTASNGALIGLCVFSLFSFYWTTQFIINFFLTVEAGIFGVYYFSGPSAKSVAWGAFKRASTYSMGSIAFGSFIVAILDLLRAGLQVLQQYESGQGDTIGAAIACCAQCCIGCVASMAQYFNRYAMIEIALYGKPYVKAAKDTWNLFKDRGIDALVNDCLINNIWTFGSFAVGALCSAFAFIYLKVSNPSYVDNNSSIKAVVMGYAFIIGFTICHTLGYGALSSGVSTIFVGLAEDPDALAERDPALFETIRVTYPRVVTSV